MESEAKMIKCKMKQKIKRINAQISKEMKNGNSEKASKLISIRERVLKEIFSELIKK